MPRRGGLSESVLTLAMLVLSGSALSVRAQQSAPADPSTKSSAPLPNVKLRNTVEDWSTITLEKSELKMAIPALGEFDKLEKYTRERWQVQWRDLDPIDLYIIKPQGVEKPPVVLYLYSTEAASKQPFINDGWCQRVTSEGFAAVAFVPALTEDRFQMRPMKQWFISELQESLGTTTHDVQMILNYLDSRNDLDLSHVGIFGSGSGATVGILAAAADPRITVLDLIDPWADWPEWLKITPLVTVTERGTFLKPEFLATIEPLDPVKWLPRLTTQQIRIQIIDEGPKEWQTAMKALANAAPQNVNVAHFATMAQHKNATVTGGGSFRWIKDQLQPPPQLLRENSAQVGGDGATVKP
jgi:hypothetical protein